MLTPAERQGLVGLRKLQARLRTGWRPDETKTGICYQLYHHFTEPLLQAASAYFLVSKWSQDWAEYSGEPEYPINVPHRGNTWAGAALSARIRLIDYMIEQLEAADAQQAS